MAGKRGNGEGSIYQRGDGLWCCAISLGYEGDKPKRKTLYGKTRKEVAEKLKIAHRDQQQGLPVAVERQTVAQFFDRWLADTIAPNRREKTHRSYAQIVRCHITPSLGRIQLAKLTPQDIQQLLRQKQDSGLSPRTVAYIRAVLRQGLNQALRWGLVSRNVATLIDPPSVKQYEAQTLSQAQAATLLGAVKGDRLEGLYTIALTLGLRQGEVLGLRWQDIDFEARTLRVAVALVKTRDGLTLGEPKSRTARRTLPLPASLAATLKAHRARQNEDRLRAGSEWQDRGLVFTTAHGTPIDPRNLIRHFHALRDRSGLPGLRFHDLRHSCLSFLAAAGVAPRTAMEIAGHSDIRLTLGTYTHAHDDSKRAALDSLDTLFAGAI